MARLPKNAPAAMVFAESCAIQLGPNRVTILRDSWCTSGRYALAENRGPGIVAFDIAPSFTGAPALRWHTRESVLATVLEGRLAVRLVESEQTIEKGGSLLIPPHCPFAWSNPDATATRLVVAYTPGGFENYFREIAAAKDLAPLCEKYGLMREG